MNEEIADAPLDNLPNDDEVNPPIPPPNNGVDGDVNGNNDDDEHENALANIRDAVVSRATLWIYINDNLSFVKWCMASPNAMNWLTDYGRHALTAMLTHPVGESTHHYNTRIHLSFKALLRNAHSDPIVHLDMLTAEGFMQYLLGLWHPGCGGYLSRSSYGNKRASFNHLFRAHNWIGMPADLCSQLTNLYQGFCVLLHRITQSVRQQDRMMMLEKKVYQRPMSKAKARQP